MNSTRSAPGAFLCTAAAVLAAGPLAVLRAQACLPVQEIVSASGNGPGNAASQDPAVSANGRFVAFASAASNLVPQDTNGHQDVFVRDMQTNVVSPVSQGAALPNGPSFFPSISADGRFVAFASDATNLVGGDVNGVRDVFVRDLQTGSLERASVSTSGFQANGASNDAALSGDGRYVVFSSAATNLVPIDATTTLDVYRHDRQTKVTELVSRDLFGIAGNGTSTRPDISSDGRYVAFDSSATTLVGGDVNGFTDVFVRDMALGLTTRVSILNDPIAGLVQGNGSSLRASMSADGSRIAFQTNASNFIPSLGTGQTDGNAATDVFARDWQGGNTFLVSRSVGGGSSITGSGHSFEPSLSPDGQWVAFSSASSNLVAGDANGFQDVFVRDLAAGATSLVSITSILGVQATAASSSPDLSSGGRFTAFDSTFGLFGPDSNGASDVFLYEFACTFPDDYCTAKLTSNGCLPTMGAQGAAQAGAAYTLTILATDVINNKPGLLFYGTAGPAAFPFQGGTFCVKPPTKRTPIQFSGGTPGSTDDCTGSYVINMGDYAHGLLGGSPLPELLVPGTVFFTQWWGRDPGYAAPNNTMLSNGLSFTVLD